jgi:hypothetical protein
MTAPELLADLRARGIRVRVVGDRFRLAPLGVLTPELLEVVRQHKPELLRLLTDRPEVWPLARRCCARGAGGGRSREVRHEPGPARREAGLSRFSCPLRVPPRSRRQPQTP